MCVRAALAAGATPAAAAYITFSIQDLVLGHTIEEQARARLADAVEPAAPLDVEQYPELRAAVSQLPPDARAQPGFDYGLELLLLGLQQRAPRRPGRRRL